MRHLSCRPGRVAAAAVVVPFVALALAGCDASASGPTCKEFLAMGDAERTTAIIDWAKEHDPQVDQDNPQVGLSGAALFRDRGSLITYCQDSSHADDRLGDLSPAGR